MSHRLSYRTAAGVLVVSLVLAPLATRFPRLNPVALLVLSPVLLLAGALTWIAVDLYATWSIERLVIRRLEAAQLRDDLSGQSRVGARVGGAEGAPGRRRSGTGVSRRRRGVPPLIFTSPAAWDVTQTRASWEHTNTSHRPPFPAAPPLLYTAIDSLFELIMRDFVLKWFVGISDSPAFPNAVEKTIRETLASLVDRVADLDWSDVIVGKVLPLVTNHVETFRSAEQALRGQDLRTQLTESDELDLFLASRYASEGTAGNLHPAVDVSSPNSRPTEEAWLSALIDRILPLIMPEREVDSAAVRIMAREIVACAVFLPIVELLSDPDFWNRMIDEKVGPAVLLRTSPTLKFQPFAGRSRHSRPVRL